jgi:hypothetical protein
MGVRTSAIFYGRGISKNNSNFAFAVQANNTVIAPMSKYLKNYQFYNRNIVNTNAQMCFFRK